ncbi:MAG: HAD family phosphatase [Crenarchaeota archaeon]|nr:HAD family phosphatase [Thermoproteota archaeon]MDW8033691.1 HAD family phosphatase [Nitrososphaerota archaeon]
MVRLVLFDLDGTLIEFNYNYSQAKKLIIGKLIEMGVEKSILSESKPASVNLEEAIAFMRNKGLNEDQLRALRRKVYETIEPLELEAAEKPILKNGIIELVEWLREKGIDMAVCTNNCRKASKIILEKTNLKIFFKYVFTRDDVDRIKPFPDLILKACNAIGTQPDNTAHVGDSPVDIMAAREAGVVPIGIVSSLWGIEKLKEAGAEYIASNTYELKIILSSLIGFF